MRLNARGAESTSNNPKGTLMRTHDYLDPGQVQDRFGIATGTLANWRSLGKGPNAVRLPNGRIRYRLADVIAWIESGSVVPA